MGLNKRKKLAIVCQGILGICMCSTEWLLWKNQKRSTRYSMILYKRETFSYEYSNFFGQAISQNSSKALIQNDFYLLRMSGYCCFRRPAQGQLSQYNRRNTATILWAVVKSHNGLIGTKVFACECSGRNLKLKILQERARAGVLLF